MLLLCLTAPKASASTRANLPEGEAASTVSNTRAKIEPSRYATILDAPPAPFTATEPSDPAPPSARQISEQQQFTRVGRFQNSVRDNVQSVVARLRRQERGNFVSVYYDNEGDLSVVFQFLRDGAKTLHKYTSHPRFLGKTVRWSMEQLRADQDFVLKTFAVDRVVQGAGIGRNEVNVDLLVNEQTFRSLVARKGARLPESVRLRFLTSPIVPLVQPDLGLRGSVSPQIAKLVRIFATDDRPNGILHSINSRAKVVLRDGCFRLADRGDALVLFPLGAQLFIDAQGYLAFGSKPTPGYARVGETIEFPGSIGEVTTPELVDPIHAACGLGKVIKVTATASAAASDVQQRTIDEFNAVRQLRDGYGLSLDQAQRAMVYLAERRAGQPRQTTAEGIALPPITPAMIIMGPPGRPVTNAANCPAGTRLSHGLCRTPGGYLRPLPDWLAKFLEKDR